MGKDDDNLAEQPDSEKENTSEGGKKTEEQNQEEQENQQEKEPEKKEEKPEKEDVEKLRKVIKVNDNNNDQEKQTEDTTDTDMDTREGLEQKRAILQSIKDFDFQIKKNQEEITDLNQKLDSVSKDLDDLVSLYEIVSEQMNPFVGLSKVTKKRLDSLENFTHEIDTLKERTAELESFAERSGAKIKRMSEGDKKVQTVDTHEILEEKNDNEKTDEVQITTEIESKPLDNTTWNNLPDNELDKIIEMALGTTVALDNKIDTIIDNFIENLKE